MEGDEIASVVLNLPIKKDVVDPEVIFRNHERVENLSDIPPAKEVMNYDPEKIDWDMHGILCSTGRNVKFVHILQMIDLTESFESDAEAVFNQLLAGRTIDFYYGAEYLVRTRTEGKWDFKHYKELVCSYANAQYLDSSLRMIKITCAKFGVNTFVSENLDLTSILCHALIEGKLVLSPHAQPLVMPKAGQKRGVGRPKGTSTKKLKLKEEAKDTKPKEEFFPKKQTIDFDAELNETFKLRGAVGLTQFMTPDFYLNYLRPRLRLTLNALILQEKRHFRRDNYLREELACHIILYGHDAEGEILVSRWKDLVWKKTMMKNGKRSPCRYTGNLETMFPEYPQYDENDVLGFSAKFYENRKEQIKKALKSMKERSKQFDAARKLQIVGDVLTLSK